MIYTLYALIFVVVLAAGLIIREEYKTMRSERDNLIKQNRSIRNRNMELGKRVESLVMDVQEEKRIKALSMDKLNSENDGLKRNLNMAKKMIEKHHAIINNVYTVLDDYLYPPDGDQ